MKGVSKVSFPVGYVKLIEAPLSNKRWIVS